MKKYYWNGLTSQEKARALKDLRDIIEDFGEILDVQKVADDTTNIVIEIEEHLVPDFRFRLNEKMSLEMGYEENRIEHPLSLVMLSVTFR